VDYVKGANIGGFVKVANAMLAQVQSDKWFLKMYIDSHTHLFLKEFDTDRDEVIKRAIHAGVRKMFLPNIDDRTFNRCCI